MPANGLEVRTQVMLMKQEALYVTFTRYMQPPNLEET